MKISEGNISSREWITLLGLILALALPAGGMAAEIDWGSPTNVLTGSSLLDGPLCLKPNALGELHLLYFNSDLNWIGHGYWREDVWSIQPVTDPIFTTWHDYSLALWGNIPWSVYYDETEGSLQFSYTMGTGWHPSEIDNTSGAVAMRYAISPTGNSHVLWVQSIGGESGLIYTHDEGGDWHNEWVTSMSMIPRYELDIALDSSGDPHMVWYNPDLDRLMRVTRIGPHHFDLDAVAWTGTVYWLDLEMLAGDVPYVGFLDSASSSEIALRSVYFNGTEWRDDVMIDDEPWIYCAGMAVATDEGIDSHNKYFVYGTDAGFVSLFRMDTWERQPLTELADYPTMTSLGMTWIGASGRAALTVIGRTDRAISFLLGEPGAAPATDLALDLMLNQSSYAAGDTLRLDLEIHNPGANRVSDVYVLLEVFGEFWFYPDWSQSLDSVTRSTSAGATVTIPIIEPVVLPAPLAAGGPFYFYAAAFEPDALDIDSLISNIETEQFSFE